MSYRKTPAPTPSIYTVLTSMDRFPFWPGRANALFTMKEYPMGILHVTLPGPIELAKARLAAAKARQFNPEGKDERVKKALAALRAGSVGFKLDADTWRWIAEDADVEYMEDGSE